MLHLPVGIGGGAAGARPTRRPAATAGRPRAVTGEQYARGPMQNPALAFRPEPGAIPDAPGCYQFKDGARAGRLRRQGEVPAGRLASYFQAWSGIAPRTRAMLEAARSVEWIVVDSEVEALHLEYTLIQRHRPRYNVRYRDDKSYPYLVLTTSEEVPARRVQRPQGRQGRPPVRPLRPRVRDPRDARPAAAGLPRPHLLAGRLRPRAADRAAVPAAPHRPVRGAVHRRGLAEEHRELVDGSRRSSTATPPRCSRSSRRRCAPPPPTSTSSRPPAAATSCRRPGGPSRSSRWSPTSRGLRRHRGARGRARGGGAGLLRPAGTAGRTQGLDGRQGRAADHRELLTSFVLQLYAERSDDVPPQVLVPELARRRGRAVDAAGRAARATREGERGRPIQRVRFTVPQRGDKLRLPRHRRGERAGGLPAHAAEAGQRLRQPVAGAQGAPGGARPRRGAAAHRVLRHLPPRRHRGGRVDGGVRGRAARRRASTAGSSCRRTPTTTSPRCARSCDDASAGSSRSVRGEPSSTTTAGPGSSPTRRTSSSSTAASASSTRRWRRSRTCHRRRRLRRARQALRGAARARARPGRAAAGQRGALPRPARPGRGAPVRGHLPARRRTKLVASSELDAIPGSAETRRQALLSGSGRRGGPPREPRGSGRGAGHLPYARRTPDPRPPPPRPGVPVTEPAVAAVPADEAIAPTS
jgi:hypothetical protein